MGLISQPSSNCQLARITPGADDGHDARATLGHRCLDGASRSYVSRYLAPGQLAVSST